MKLRMVGSWLDLPGAPQKSPPECGGLAVNWWGVRLLEHAHAQQTRGRAEGAVLLLGDMHKPEHALFLRGARNQSRNRRKEGLLF